MKRAKQSLRQVFAVPAVLAVLSLVGLIAALTGDGLRDVLSWIALGVPVLAVVWAMRFRRS
ncbi:hypothetical protein V474_05300 [Novosphingobium barchaimii LL02]|uniref:DUF4175 domain-containing protein n=1 Tax=Novosphingobium barchaimii LL02 TaxID=1114963 RepID=A0A0J7XGK4_9SPHN|nr:hypothetical protein [Novosphingobium barchaimii]KMS51171.1 hypothetical protein V474_05300 [Novosphingobium barchaimii LL02]